jgi:hypothetical protein
MAEVARLMRASAIRIEIEAAASADARWCLAQYLFRARHAHATLPLDIMSEAEGRVGAETFAVVDPRNTPLCIFHVAEVPERE